MGLMIAIGASAKQAQATITCSAGNSGRCYAVQDAGDWVPYYKCSWTGRQDDNCTWVHEGIRNLLMFL